MLYLIHLQTMLEKLNKPEDVLIYNIITREKIHKKYNQKHKIRAINFIYVCLWRKCISSIKAQSNFLSLFNNHQQACHRPNNQLLVLAMEHRNQRRKCLIQLYSQKIVPRWLLIHSTKMAFGRDK